MELEESSLATFLRSNLLILLLSGVGLLLLGYGLYQLVLQKDDSPLVIEKTSVSSPEASVSANKKPIVVDVQGAVEKPGVYTLPQDSRVNDALALAGGISSEADKGAVAKGINLASPLLDGMKLYIPYVGEEVVVTSVQNSQAVAGVETSGKIRLNSASSSELDSLPGVGPVTVDKIIQNRPYASLEELVNKKAVTQSVFDKIKDQIDL